MGSPGPVGGERQALQELASLGVGGGATGRQPRSHGRCLPRPGRALAEATAACCVSAGPGGRAGDPREPLCPCSPFGRGASGPRAFFLGLLLLTWGRGYRSARPLCPGRDSVMQSCTAL